MSDIGIGLTWLQKHERIVIAFMVLLVGGWLGNKWIDHSAAKDKIAVVADKQDLKDQKVEDKNLANQSQVANAQYQQTVAALTKANAALADAIVARDSALKKQQNADWSMPVPQLASRWQSLVIMKPDALTVGDHSLTITEEGGRQTVSVLEQVPVLTQNLQAQTTIATNKQQELDKANVSIGALTNQVAGLNVEIGKANKMYNDDTSLLKADARKGKRNWFVAGVAIGAGVAAYFIHK